MVSSCSTPLAVHFGRFASSTTSPIEAVSMVRLVDFGDYHRADIQRILDSKIPYQSQNERKLAAKLVETLTPEERELAAHGSFAYWLASISSAQPTEAERLRMATREARRFLGNPYDVAEVGLKQACRFRKDCRIDLVRSCFMYGVEYESDTEAALADQIRHKICSDLMKQKAYVRGRDKEGRALLIMHPRTSAGTVEDEFVTTIIYLMERAIAFTEFDSAGRIEKISAVFDFASFNSSLAPSTDAMKRVTSVLQNSYSERLQKLVIVDPPFWMRTAWGILKPFLHPVTRAKIVMATGHKSKLSIIGGIIDESEAMPFLLPTGHLSDEVEVDVFTKNVPFQKGYDRRHADWNSDLFKLTDDSITSEESELTQDDAVELPAKHPNNEWQEVHV